MTDIVEELEEERRKLMLRANASVSERNNRRIRDQQALIDRAATTIKQLRIVIHRLVLDETKARQLLSFDEAEAIYSREVE